MNKQTSFYKALGAFCALYALNSSAFCCEHADSNPPNFLGAQGVTLTGSGSLIVVPSDPVATADAVGDVHIIGSTISADGGVSLTGSGALTVESSVITASRGRVEVVQSDVTVRHSTVDAATMVLTGRGRLDVDHSALVLQGRLDAAQHDVGISHSSIDAAAMGLTGGGRLDVDHSELTLQGRLDAAQRDVRITDHSVIIGDQGVSFTGLGTLTVDNTSVLTVPHGAVRVAHIRANGDRAAAERAT